MAAPLADDSTDSQVAKVGEIANPSVTLKGEAIEDVHKQQRPLGLLSLPLEIWIKICKLAVLCDKATVRFGCGIKSEPHTIISPGHAILQYPMRPAFELMRIVRQPGITRTCRMIRNETLPSFYSTNKFIVRVDVLYPPLYKWLDAIGAANRRHISVVVREYRKNIGVGLLARLLQLLVRGISHEQENFLRRVTLNHYTESMRGLLKQCYGDYDGQLECDVEDAWHQGNYEEGIILDAKLVIRERSRVHSAK